MCDVCILYDIALTASLNLNKAIMTRLDGEFIAMLKIEQEKIYLLCQKIKEKEQATNKGNLHQ